MELRDRILELERQIANLPTGSITKKNVNGKEYFYHRWTEDRKRKEKYIAREDEPTFRKQLEKRRALEKELKDMQKQFSLENTRSEFVTNIIIDDTLSTFISSVRRYKKREIFDQLLSYLCGETQDKVFILYGLRRTGKTTMMRQAIAQMTDDDLKKTAFIQITLKDTLAGVNQDLKTLLSLGYKYVFIDEVTLMDDFVEGAALFSDVFVSCGMKIVLSGTDSLGFLFAGDEELYDRCIVLHTTYIPYREFESVLGIYGIDEYIRYGGTMSLGGIHYNKTSTFASKERADEYVDTAIARNIQHSLRIYQHEGHFRHLQDLYEKNELTNVINRVVEDINHRFTLEVLERDWKSNDLALSASNLRRDRNNPTDILDHIDIKSVTERLRALLEIINKNEQSVELDNVHMAEIKEYLNLLDLTENIDVLYLPDVSFGKIRTVISQPGLRYAQADALIKSLLLDETFASISLAERNAIQSRILAEIKGRMLEDIVLLETKLAYPDKQVFVLQFPIGEFDMVIFDPSAASCQIYEVKHSTEIASSQYRHLVDVEKCAQTEHRYGPIIGKFVLYRGENKVVEGIQYQNVEEYLRTI